MSRDNRKHIAQDTLHILDQGFYINGRGKKISIAELQHNAVGHTKLYRPEETDQMLLQELPVSLAPPATCSVVRSTTLDAVRTLAQKGENRVVALNFASAKNPGGGFLGGSQAQEESIARATGLFPTLLAAEEYYDVNRKTKSCMYTDYMIYSPDIPIIKDEAGSNLEEPVLCSIITAPAVNYGVVAQRETNMIHTVPEVMKRRIAKVLSIAATNGHRAIVLGAWGCGVFKNDPDKIARYFYEVIESEYKNQFSTIVFAIYSKNERFVRPFEVLFGAEEMEVTS